MNLGGGGCSEIMPLYSSLVTERDFVSKQKTKRTRKIEIKGNEKRPLDGRHRGSRQ